MPIRTIRCQECDAYVGTIRDAKLMKDLVFVCPSCYGPVHEPVYKQKATNREETDNGLDYILNMFKGGKR